MVQGIVRAKIDQTHQGDFSKVVPILIHGDASIAGQGIVYEIAQMSELKGYKTGGTIHLVVNNQIGFTTDYLDARSSIYCTDVAKVTQSPIFHVNGDDPEAVVYAIQTALEIREKFQKDVYVDLLCYRKYGHNEGDEPRFTQPLLYNIIEKHPNPREIYAKKILAEGIVNQEELDQLEKHHIEILETSLTGARAKLKTNITNFLQETWSHVRKSTKEDFDHSPETGFNRQLLNEIAAKLSSLPSNLNFFRKTVKLMEQHHEMYFNKHIVDWSLAEQLAYGSLLMEGFPVRLSGQDVQRGTFSHRHAVLRVEDSEQLYTPLDHIGNKQARFDVYNSLLSEYGVLGFEYGYALASPQTLTIWEAQFGDFNNGAQIIIDQFITSAEEKWNVMNDLVVLLPHGYEGQGPEHSSGRMERFLTLCAEQNIQVANCSTPANFFHILRRQLKRPFRKPLIVFSPKSLLRHPRCISNVDELVQGKFHELIDDPLAQPEEVTKILLCTGKVYYELLEEKERLNRNDVAIVRIEQLYPFPHKQLSQIIAKYAKARTYIWVQEEPLNMGAWRFIQSELHNLNISTIAKPKSGSPSTGSSKFHNIRQQKIIDKAFETCECPLVNTQCNMICIGNKWQSFEDELKTLHVDMIDSKFHSALKKLE